MVLRPWFYAWSLLTRCIPPGSTVYRAPQPPGDLRILATRSPLGDWTFVAVNRGDAPAHLLLKAPGHGVRTFQVYEYSRASAVTDADGFPVPVEALTVAPETGVDLLVPGASVMMATSVPTSLAVKPATRP
jgi:hypothetical protein